MILEEKLEKLDENSSLKDIQEYMNEMIEIRGFDKETPQDILLLLTEELGELAKAVRKTTDIKNDIEKSDDHDIEGELADVFEYLMAMCRALEIDLFQAFKNKEKRNCKRTWG